MKRILLPVTMALMLLGTAACSSTGAYNRQTEIYSGEGSEGDLQVAGLVCDSKVGKVRVGQDTPDAYKQCMLAQGWEYEKITRSFSTAPYTDHRGRTCQDFVILGVVGSRCGY
jgi:hypothetical protein